MILGGQVSLLASNNDAVAVVCMIVNKCLVVAAAVAEEVVRNLGTSSFAATTRSTT